MEPQRVVIAAVDFSAISPAVVRAARRMAHKNGADCLVVHVVEALQGGEEDGPLLPSLRRWVQKVAVDAERSLAGLLRRLTPEDSVVLRGEVLRGRAFARLIRLARERQAHCLVLGGPPPSRQLGTTAERVVRKSPLPVLVVRRPPAEGYRRVLVGVDFSAGSARGVQLALAAATEGAEITACHVLNTRGLPRSDAVAAADRCARQRLRAWVREVLPDSPVTCRTLTGTPKSALLQLAQEEQMELLVVGSRGKSQLSHLLLGSVAEAAVRRCECDVLVAGEERSDFCLP